MTQQAPTHADRRGRRALIALCAALVIRCVAATAAVAAPPALIIGPIAAHHGYRLTIQDLACSPATSNMTLRFATRPDAPAHAYTGGGSSCRASADLSSASLDAHWGRLVTVHLRLHAVGRSRRVTPPAGCTAGSRDRAEAAIATGTLTVAIHRRAFGRIALTRVHAAIERLPGVRCPAPAGSGWSLHASFGHVGLGGWQTTDGARHLLVVDPDEAPGAGVIGDMTLATVGASAFSIAPRRGTAAVGPRPPALTGGLSFTALPACAGSPEARNGTFTGTLVVHDPIFGAVTLRGTRATSAYIARTARAPGLCNGVDALPPRAAFDDSCAVDSVCAIDLGTNTATFTDDSDPGTESIVGESWSFGDGTVAPGRVGGQVRHAYANPGVYSVTLTLIDSLGHHERTTHTVYIDP
jgi:hypothetical protein